MALPKRSITLVDPGECDQEAITQVSIPTELFQERPLGLRPDSDLPQPQTTRPEEVRDENARTLNVGVSPQPTDRLSDRLMGRITILAAAAVFGLLLYVAVTGPLASKLVAAGIFALFVGILIATLFYAMNLDR